MKVLETVEIIVSANDKENGKTDFNLKVEAKCSLHHLACLFKRMGKEDPLLREAMYIAVTDDLLEEMKQGSNKKDLSDIDLLLKNIQAQA